MPDLIGPPVPNSGGPNLIGPPVRNPLVIPPGMNPMEFFLQRVPGWQFAFNQANRAIGNSAGARGTLLGRQRTLNALGNYYVPGVADQTYGNQVNRYLSLADLGLRSATAPFI